MNSRITKASILIWTLLLVGVLAVLVLAMQLQDGAVQAQGTGDIDGDGVPDAQDECPDVPGPPENSGCPLNPEGDNDEDGVPNVRDRCPFIPGPAENDGCPISEETEEPEEPTLPPPPPPPTDIPTPVPTVFVPPNIPDSGQCLVGTVGATVVNIRSQPSINAPIVGVLQPTQTYLVISQTVSEGATWYQITSGWVSGSVVRVGGECGSTDFPEPDLTTGEPGEPLPDETWTGITIGAAVCPDWLLYHSNAEQTWDVFRLFQGEALNLSDDAESQDIQPTYSDDAVWMAFTSDRDAGNWEIYVKRTDGESEALRMTFNTSEDINPVWGPQNSGIVFETNRDAIWQLYHFDVAATGLANALATPLTGTDGNSVNAFWSPDGSTIYYQSDEDGDWEIYSIKPDSGEITQLTDNGVADVDPVISTDGAWLAWRREGLEDKFDLWMMNLSTGDTFQMTNTDENVQGIGFSDSGAFIAFHMRTGGSLELFAVSTDTETRTIKQVTENSRINDLSATFRCGSDTIMFQSNLEGQFDLYEVDALPLDGPPNEPVRLTFTDDADEIFPMGNPHTENNSREGRLP